MAPHSRRRAAPERSGPAATVLTVSLVVVGALAVLGAIAFWPRGSTPDLGMPPPDYVDATIVDIEEDVCPSVEANRPDQMDECTLYSAELTSGDDAGEDVVVTVPATFTDIPELSVDDEVVLRHNPTSPPEYRYSFEDFQRSTPMLWLLVAFVVFVVVFGRWLGVRALAGLGLSLLVVVLFIVPALLRDSPELLVALIGTALVAYLAIYLAHGVNLASSIALTGTLVSLSITAGLAMVVVGLTQLSGLTSEETQVLRVTVAALDLRGLLIAGIVIGALGVLDDVTVSQVSTVSALRRANAALTGRQLYREAIQVGRDHVAAAVNTLVLAYAGASLPLLLFFAQGNQPVARLLTGELMAMEIVRMLVGSIGLILSVPVTTALAAMILARMDPIAGDGHGHSHGLPGDAGQPLEPFGALGAREPAVAPRRRAHEEETRPWF